MYIISGEKSLIFLDIWKKKLLHIYSYIPHSHLFLQTSLIYSYIPHSHLFLQTSLTSIPTDLTHIYSYRPHWYIPTDLTHIYSYRPHSHLFLQTSLTSIPTDLTHIYAYIPHIYSYRPHSHTFLQTSLTHIPVYAACRCFPEISSKWWCIFPQLMMGWMEGRGRVTRSIAEVALKRLGLGTASHGLGWQLGSNEAKPIIARSLSLPGLHYVADHKTCLPEATTISHLQTDIPGNLTAELPCPLLPDPSWMVVRHERFIVRAGHIWWIWQYKPNNYSRRGPRHWTSIYEQIKSQRFDGQGVSGAIYQRGGKHPLLNVFISFSCTMAAPFHPHTSSKVTLCWRPWDVGRMHRQLCCRT